MGPIYIFGVHPLHNPQKLFQVYQPLIDYLNRHLPKGRLRLEASRDYGEFERKLADRYFHFALPNPYQTVVMRGHGYHVFGKMGEDDQFRGLILVRRDSGIQVPADLRGKAVSYPAPTALAATILPQWFLHKAGLDLERDLVSLYVGSQESAIMNVYLGKSAAGGTWPPPWRAFVREHPDIAGQLEVKWETPPSINNSLMEREDMPADLVERLGSLLFGLDRSQEGRDILAGMEVARFEAADDARYEPVAKFLRCFEDDVRPVGAP